MRFGTENLFRLSLVLLWSTLSGCAMNRDPSQDPFAAQAAAEKTMKQAGVQSGVTQASYQNNADDVEEVRPAEPEGWEKYSIDNWGKNFKAMIGQGPNKKIAKEAYDIGKKLFSEAEALTAAKKTADASKKYLEAGPYFVTAADRWPDSNLEEDALFMRAECYFFADGYVDAEDVYQQLATKYPNTRYLDTLCEREFKIAYYWQELYKANPGYGVNLTDKTRPWTDADGHAVRVYENIRLNAPRGRLADDAVMAAANIHFLGGNFSDADHLYGVLRNDYPKSEHLQDAFMLGKQCKIKLYQGEEYDDKPLIEAGELIDQILVNFPTLPRDERERLITEKAKIKADRALRDWTTAQFYESGDYYRGAKFYYQKICKEFPDTPFSAKAQERLAAIKDKPDNPPDRYEFLNYIFGPPNGKAGMRPK